MNEQLNNAFRLLDSKDGAADWIQAALIFEKEGEAYKTQFLYALQKAAKANEPHALFLLGKQEADEQKRLSFFQKAASNHPEACYHLALREKDKNEKECRRLLQASAEGNYLPAVAHWIEENKTSSCYEDRLTADRWILHGFGMGLCGYELLVARMLFEGIGVYSKAALGCTNRKRAVEILLQLEHSQEKALLLGKYLLTAEEFPMVLIGEHNITGHLLPPPQERLPSYPQQAIEWLKKADCAEGYEILGQFYQNSGDTDTAKAYFQKAWEKDPQQRILERIAALSIGEETDPEERLSFLLEGLDPEEKLRTLKKALWEVTHEGYCCSMKQSLDQGRYDPDALLWKKLFSLKKAIEILYDKYQNTTQQ